MSALAFSAVYVVLRVGSPAGWTRRPIAWSVEEAALKAAALDLKDHPEIGWPATYVLTADVGNHVPLEVIVDRSKDGAWKAVVK